MPDFLLLEDASGDLTLRRPDHSETPRVKVRAAFPWTNPRRHLSLIDKEGKEVGHVDDLDALPHAQREIIGRWIGRHTLVPRITAVHALDVTNGQNLRFEVDTDRGPAEFRVAEREDVRFLSPGRFALKDTDGNVYEIADADALDPASRKRLDQLV